MVTALCAVVAGPVLAATPASETAAPHTAILDGARAAAAALEALQAAVAERRASGLRPVPAVAPGAGGCDGAVRRAAAAYGVPEMLALAVAEVESGRRPWSVNSALTGRSFGSRDEAIRYVQGERRQGVATIDVGCLQVNLYWHAKAFATLGEAFDPDRNAAAGLERLAVLRREAGSWTVAVARYHGGPDDEQDRYVCAVTDAYRRLMGRPGGCAAERGPDSDPDRTAAGVPIADLGPDAATRDRIERAQARLASLGLLTDGRKPDGAIGPATARALAAFQRARGLPASGRLTAETAAALGVMTTDHGGNPAGARTAGAKGGSGVVMADRETGR